MNHSKNYVDPDTKYHTQGIERAWCEAKAYTKSARGYSHLLQYHLDEMPWRNSVASGEKEIMTEFWHAVGQIHDTKN